MTTDIDALKAELAALFNEALDGATPDERADIAIDSMVENASLVIDLFKALSAAGASLLEDDDE